MATEGPGDIFYKPEQKAGQATNVNDFVCVAFLTCIFNPFSYEIWVFFNYYYFEGNIRRKYLAQTVCV